MSETFNRTFQLCLYPTRKARKFLQRAAALYREIYNLTLTAIRIYLDKRLDSATVDPRPRIQIPSAFDLGHVIFTLDLRDPEQIADALLKKELCTKQSSSQLSRRENMRKIFEPAVVDARTAVANQLERLAENNKKKLNRREVIRLLLDRYPGFKGDDSNLLFRITQPETIELTGFNCRRRARILNRFRDQWRRIREYGKNGALRSIYVFGHLAIPNLDEAVRYRGRLSPYIDPDEDLVKNIFILRGKRGTFFARVVVEQEGRTPSQSTPVIGIDIGIRNIVALSDGTILPHPERVRWPGPPPRPGKPIGSWTPRELTAYLSKQYQSVRRLQAREQKLLHRYPGVYEERQQSLHVSPDWDKKSEKQRRALRRPLKHEVRLGSRAHRRRKALIQRLRNRTSRIKKHCRLVIARWLVERYPGAVFVCEDINTPRLVSREQRSMTRNQARGFFEVGHAEIKDRVAFLASQYGGRLVQVNPFQTSKICPSCGCIDKDNRKNGSETFTCVSCGFSENADVVAAINVLRRGLEGINSSINNAVPLVLPLNVSQRNTAP